MTRTRLPFSGRFLVQLDAKNRIILPAPLRKLADLEDSSGDFYLTTFTTGCLHLYTAAGFRERLETMRENIESIEDNDAYEEAELNYQRFLHHSTPLRINDQGRLLVPAELSDVAGLKKNAPVRIVGSFEVIEIWSPGKYEDRFGPLDTDPDRADRTLRTISRRRGTRRTPRRAARSAEGIAEGSLVDRD